MTRFTGMSVRDLVCFVSAMLVVGIVLNLAPMVLR